MKKEVVLYAQEKQDFWIIRFYFIYIKNYSNKGDLKMINGIKEVLEASKEIWREDYMDVFYNMKDKKVFYVIKPLKDVSKHFYNIREFVNINTVFVTSIYSNYKFNETILENLVNKAVADFMNIHR